MRTKKQKPLTQEQQNRQYYLSIGRCPRCGGKRPLYNGRVLCEVCAEKHDAEQARRVNQWREAGRCTRCGGETDADHVQCQSCREYMSPIRSKASKKWRDGLKERGMCTQCGKTWAEIGHSYCAKCLQKHAEQHKKYDPNGDKQRARRQARIDAGLCIDCGAPTEGKSRCSRCLEMQLDRTRKHTILKRMDREAELARQGVYRA